MHRGGMNHDEGAGAIPSRVDCLVVGGGPAGIAASKALRERGVEHLVLERDRVGQSWRTQRWDSLRLNNPGWMNPMLGEQPSDGYLRASEVVHRLEKLAGTCPLREGVAVTAADLDGENWRVQTSEGEVRTANLVAATGGENAPVVPSVASRMPSRIAQFHASAYRNPNQLPEGAVLVVGSAQSGCQIAADLRNSGRDVFLSTSKVGRAPAQYRGRPTVEWLFELGFFDDRPEDLPDPEAINYPQPLLAPGGRSMSLQSAARTGIVLTGRLVDCDGRALLFDDDAVANVAYADAAAAGICGLIDDRMQQRRHSAPEAEQDEAGGDVPLDAPQQLAVANVGSIIWCSGYRGDFRWIRPEAALTSSGQPRRMGIAGAVPGLFYIGLRWLTRRSSGNFLGFPGDAALVGNAVAGRRS